MENHFEGTCDLRRCDFIQWVGFYSEANFLYSNSRFILVQIDHSIVESFGGKGKTCITARVYPELAINTEAHLYAFNNGNQTLNISTLSAWSMKNAEMVPTN